MSSKNTWIEYLNFPNSLDGALRLGFVLAVSVLIVANSFVFEEPYALKLADLQKEGWWRFLLLIAFALGSVWCPRVGIVVGLLIFLYLSDVEMLSKPFVKIV